MHCSKNNLLTFVISALIISACSTTEIIKPDTSDFDNVIRKSNEQTNLILARAAILAAKAQAVRARTQQALAQKLLTADQIRQAKFQARRIPEGMDRKVRLPWVGAPEPVIQKIATLSGYQLFYRNQPKPIPEDVYIDNQRRNLKDFIDIVASQSAGYIDDIFIDDEHNHKSITIVYSKF
ncbi:MAG: DotD/TraH family lipoprotein [Endozoicomonadaceae bacterium]|nr:DotD/TraH family lipoprotein [Endozoicomonadaceae bacterium]